MQSATVDYCYIIPFHIKEFDYRLFDLVDNFHEHIPAPYVEVISFDELPEDMQENYLAYLEYLNR